MEQILTSMDWNSFFIGVVTTVVVGGGLAFLIGILGEGL